MTRKPIVLVVDDERAIRGALERLLANEFDVRSVAGGAEALEFVAETEVDAILCDLSMPEMSGMELYDRLQEKFPTQAARLVFMTGSSHDPRIRGFLDTHKDRPLLEKPFRKSEAMEALGRVIPKSG
jgi:CheY-like chemotaxis protein